MRRVTNACLRGVQVGYEMAHSINACLRGVQVGYEMGQSINACLRGVQVGYEVGSRGARLPDYCMNELDEKLVPVIHGAVSPGRQSTVLELIFHVLHQQGDSPGGAEGGAPAPGVG